MSRSPEDFRYFFFVKKQSPQSRHRRPRLLLLLLLLLLVHCCCSGGSRNNTSTFIPCVRFFFSFLSRCNPRQTRQKHYLQTTLYVGKRQEEEKEIQGGNSVTQYEKTTKNLFFFWDGNVCCGKIWLSYQRNPKLRALSLLFWGGNSSRLCQRTHNHLPSFPFLTDCNLTHLLLQLQEGKGEEETTHDFAYQPSVILFHLEIIWEMYFATTTDKIPWNRGRKNVRQWDYIFFVERISFCTLLDCCSFNSFILFFFVAVSPSHCWGKGKRCGPPLFFSQIEIFIYRLHFGFPFNSFLDSAIH